jgi:type IV secretory pathway VirD2 relaxase
MASAGLSGAGKAMFDTRQRAVVKVHYFKHAGGGGGALAAHVRYVARDGAEREEREPSQAEKVGREAEARAHAKYLERDRQGPSPFYNAAQTGLDGAAIAEGWARSDLRHFRVVLAPERGAALGDLKSYTREVMARAELALGTRLQWIAVDHWDTDNPHSHIIVRGRRANGQDLVLPRDFIKDGFRDIARTVAQEWLGPRTRDDERRALEHEIRRHAPTRLDRWIEAQTGPEGLIRLAAIEGGDAERTQALKARANELKRLGLAKEVRRGVFKLEPDWRLRLERMQLHLDIRKRVMQQRAPARTLQPKTPPMAPPRTPLR